MVRVEVEGRVYRNPVCFCDIVLVDKAINTHLSTGNIVDPVKLYEKIG